MPSCSVPGCRSNYRNEGEFVKVFQFPSDKKQHAEWLRKIPRKDWTPGKRSVVCLKHFKDEDVIKEDCVQRPDGSMLRVQRDKFKLVPGAVPCIFPNLPQYLSDSASATCRKDPSVRRGEQLQREEEKIDKFLSADIISSFLELSQKDTSRHLWNSISEVHRKIFYKVNMETTPVTISSSFVVHSDLKIDVYVNQKKEKKENLLHLLEVNCEKCLILKRWSQLENLYVYVENKEGQCHSRAADDINEIVDKIKQFIENEDIDVDEIAVQKFGFLAEQFSLTMKKPKGRKYSPTLLAWAFSVFMKSPACYKEIYHDGMLCVPHVRSLHKLSSLVSVSGSIEGTESFKFLKAKAQKLEAHELIVNLMLDEIIIRPEISYVSDSLSGFSINKELAKANSIQSFMISSLYSDNKDVVALFPVRNLSAKELLPMTKTVLETVHKAGFHVISMISDNNRINRNMFVELCGGSLKTHIPNPANPQMPLYILFDSVHIIKSIRNNWINQRTDRITFHFPDPEKPERILSAPFDALRDLHQMEKGAVVKLAPKLSDRALFPNSVERQNVNLCLRIFHISNVHAAKALNEEQNEGLIKFLEIIIKWWNVANVRNVRKGLECLDPDSLPFSNPRDDRLTFLIACKQWLDKWEEVKLPNVRGRQGKLTSETLCAFRHTVEALHDLIIYLICVKNDKYVLTGKFQTDNLEGRFGQYRQLNGGSYTLSVDQVMKSEKKLRISGLLKLHSSYYGSIPVTEFMLDFADDVVVSDGNPPDVELKGFTYCNREDEEDCMPLVILLSGYAVHRLKKRVQCGSCIDILSTSKQIILDEGSINTVRYFSAVDRGALTYPTAFVTQVFLVCLRVFNCILCKSNEHLLAISNVKALLIKLAGDKIAELEGGEICRMCKTSKYELAMKCVPIFFNIFLSNYAKVRNDVALSAQKRKYDVLQSSV